ncbi:hypothetical protein N7481_001531 [Penicillium waksmanii]|uniref:uncharacterized protein n=1 Tax=Penicillium waksmanii TaxID=69791 RepID=UPI002548837F|nr:uncharacterized protein N7481_001531 [Penicillium waksmanii]KAJ6001122.1 hypothetical protein N7481_001531 [Penicillium waksmanii]
MERDCRLFQCQGDYIKHLELRIIELETACLSHYPELRREGQCRPCEVCRNPNLYTKDFGGPQESSGDSFRLASEICQDNQSSQNDRPPESTFAIIPYEPSIIIEPPATTDSSTPNVPAQKKRCRFSSFTSSVGDLPESSNWKKWASISETQRKKIVLSLVSGLTFPNDENPIASRQPAPIPILLEYGKSMEPAGLTHTSAKSAEKRPFACFQELVFCSLCAVALEVTAKEDVFQAMQSVFQSDAGSKSLRARIRGAKWANRAIHLLSLTKWGSCSWDIIYVGMKHISSSHG